MSTRLVHQIAARAEREPGVEIIEHGTMAWVEWADEASTGRREKLRQAFEREAELQGIRETSDQAERAERLLRLFDERGSAAFRETRLEWNPLWPSVDNWYPADHSAKMLQPLGLVTILLGLGVALISIAGMSDLAKVDATLEWWFTFPVPTRGLLLARVVETAIANPLAWFFLFPFFSVVFWCAGYSLLGIPLGLVAMAYVGLLAGSLRVVMETGLRRFLALRNVARFQAVLSVFSYLPIIIAFGVISPEWLDTLSSVGDRFPRWVLANPLLPVGLAAGGSQAMATGVACLLFAACATTCATAVGTWLLRDGLVTGAGPNQGRRGRAARDETTRGIALAAVARKELTLLFRDRTLFAQAFVMPAFILGMQFVMNRRWFGLLSEQPRHAAAIAFATGALVLATGACNTLVLEVPALWIYFAVPRSLDRLLVQKAAFWGALASAIALIAFAIVTRASPAAFVAALPPLSLAIVGVVLYAFIAAGIGVLGTNALEIEPRRRIRVSMVYLYMLLASMFGYALYSPSAWAKFAQVVLSAWLAAALWQKVRDHVPYLLDPNEAPPPTLAVADGVLAALAFFVLQGLLALLLAPLGRSPGATLLFAFAGAGLLTWVVMLFVFWRSKMPDLLATLGLRAPRHGVLHAVLLGLAGGLCSGLVGRAYLVIVDRVEFLRVLRDETISLSPAERAPGVLPWFLILALVAAPIFEEFIFRAVLYGGFRRSLGPLRAAGASALVFAIIHPPISTAPVFVLAVIAAVVYERSRSLLSPILSHMIYNAMVVGFALSR